MVSNNQQVGESILINSLSELQSICESFNFTDCGVNYLGGMNILLEFKNKKDEFDSKYACFDSDSQRSVKEGKEIRALI